MNRPSKLDLDSLCRAGRAKYTQEPCLTNFCLYPLAGLREPGEHWLRKCKISRCGCWPIKRDAIPGQFRGAAR